MPGIYGPSFQRGRRQGGRQRLVALIEVGWFSFYYGRVAYYYILMVVWFFITCYLWLGSSEEFWSSVLKVYCFNVPLFRMLGGVVV